MLRVHVITLPFDAALGRFDDAPVQEFLADKELVEVRDHFFTLHHQPHLALVLIYRLGEAAARTMASAARAKRERGWRELLGEGDLPIFNTLREWRSERAKRDGVPPYVICNNRQLAQVVRRRPRRQAELGEVEGFGKGKLSRYGAEILGILKTAGARQGSAEEGDDRGEG